MAEFSKEYIEKYHDPEDWGFDFSIMDEFNELQEGHYIGIICEGYGFIGICKENGECKLIFGKGEEVEYIKLDDLDDYYSKINGYEQ